MAIELEWVSDYRRWRRAQSLVQMNLPSFRRTFIFWYIGMPIVAVGLLLLALMDFRNNYTVDLKSLTTWGVGLGTWSVVNWATRERRYRRLYDESWLRRANRVTRLRVDKEGVKVAHPDLASSDFQWSAFTHTSEKGDLMVLHLSPTRFLIIPLALLTVEQNKELYQLLDLHVIRKRY